MRFDILTLFPKIFDSYFGESILKRAREAGKIAVDAHNIRDWTTDKHKTTDDIPYGGGAGMVMKVEPIYRAVSALKGEGVVNDVRREGVRTARVVLFSAKGKQFTQRDAERFARYEQLILICGRYEGVDERVAEYIADEELSIGPYVLTGGEIPAMVVVDSVSRLLPGVLGNQESLQEESHNGNAKRMANSDESGGEGRDFLREYPQYTRPEVFRGWRVPKVLLGGNHAEIRKWRDAQRNRA